MVVRRLGVALLVAAWAAAPLGASAAVAATIGDFAGLWRGVELSAPGGGPAPGDLTAEDLGVAIAPERDGFKMAWTPPGGERVEASFAPSDRPGVFLVRPSTNPLLSLFVSPETGNPLKGERLLWSRLEGDALVVYSLELDEEGDFDLRRYAWTLEGGGRMGLDFSRLSEGLTETALTGRLERVGG